MPKQNTSARTLPPIRAKAYWPPYGTVILSTYTAETGYLIEIQHNQDFVSVYKHCGSLLKREGDAVKGGEAIALVGNTGELSTGPHLHFELWHKGRAVNPELYIVF